MYSASCTYLLSLVKNFVWFFLHPELPCYVSDWSAFSNAVQNNVSETQVKACLISCWKYQSVVSCHGWSLGQTQCRTNRRRNKEWFWPREMCISLVSTVRISNLIRQTLKRIVEYTSYIFVRTSEGSLTCPQKIVCGVNLLLNPPWR
jgi:hypothetical protein